MSETGAHQDASDAAAVFEAHRRLLMGVAYRVIGSVADAEDIVQEAWLRWAGVSTAEVADPGAYLVRVTTRLAIDRLRRVAARRESYVGPWLPEPLLTAPDVAENVERAESVSLALLVVLETLSPLERAVFVLREAFAYSHGEIAEIIGRGEPAVRQLAARARAHVREQRPRFDADEATHRRVAEGFFAACAGGDLAALMGLLAPEVTLVADGGGLVRAPRLPVEGPDKVARFLLAVAAQPLPVGRIRPVRVNGGPGILVSAEDEPVAVLALDVTGGLVRRVYLVANPGKLAGARAPAVR